MAESDISVEDFRQKARDWLSEHGRRTRDVALRPRGASQRTREDVERQKAEAQSLFDAGFAGITIAKEYGGQGLSTAHQAAFDEEAQPYVLPPGPNMPCMGAMLAHGSPEFLRRTIPRMLAGEVWVQFFSEPVAGSDLAGIRTRATRDGDSWILSGSKIWSTGAFTADYGMCLARTNWDVPKHKGLTWFAVKTDLPGLTIQPITEISGGQDFCQEFFDDVELSDDDRICDVDQGWPMAQTMLVYERGGAPRGAGGRSPRQGRSGVARRALAPDLVALARRGGRDKDAAVRQLIAKAHINDFAHAALGVRVGQLIQAGAADAAGLASYGKLASGTLDPIRARIGVHIAPSEALVWKPGDVDAQAPALNFLNGRIMAIAGGTNEMQRNAISERVLGLPREPSFDSNKPFRDVIRDSVSWTGRVS